MGESGRGLRAAIILLAGLATLAVWLPGRTAQEQSNTPNSASCVKCHQGIESMHANFEMECVDCHGGDGAQESKERAHILPRNKQVWRTSANPPNSYAWLNEESPEFVRFINPSDLRIAHLTCGPCHGEQVR